MKLHGQMTIIGIIMSFIAILFFVALTPVATQMIAVGMNATNDSTVQMLLPIMWVTVGFGILVTIIMYTTANRPQG